MYQYMYIVHVGHMFTLAKTSNDVKFHFPCHFRELLNKYLRWSQSRAKVTAPALAKYPGSGTLLISRTRITLPTFLGEDRCPKTYCLGAGSGGEKSGSGSTYSKTIPT